MSLKHGKYKIDYVLELKKYKMKIYTKLKNILLRQISDVDLKKNVFLTPKATSFRAGLLKNIDS